MCTCVNTRVAYAREARVQPVVRVSFLKHCIRALRRRLKWALRGTMELKTNAERSIASRFVNLLFCRAVISVALGTPKHYAGRNERVIKQ